MGRERNLFEFDCVLTSMLPLQLHRKAVIFRAWVCLLSALTALGWSMTARGEAPALLKQALDEFKDADGLCWAYTETRSQSLVDAKGAPISNGKHKMEVFRTRIDPSKTYDEQFVPLAVDGQPPSAKHVEKCRKRCENAAKKAERRTLEEAKKAEREAAEKPAEKKESHGGKFAGSALDLEHAVVVADDPLSITYQLPLPEIKNEKFDSMDFELRIRVNKEQHMVENMHLRMKKSMRVKLIVKIRAMEVDADFRRVQPNLPPAMVSIKATVDCSAFFKNFNMVYTCTNEDYVRVKSYDKRFRVNSGPLELLNFQ